MTTTSTREATTTDDPAPDAVPWGLPAAVGGALALAVCNALVGYTPGQQDIGSTADLVRVVEGHQLLTEAVVATGLLAVALLVPGIWAVTAVLRRRAPRLAGLGGWAMATGYVFSIALSVESSVALAVARSGGDPAPYAEAMDSHLPVTSIALYAVFGLGALGGGLLLGAAMLRQRDAVPVWAGAALVASEPVRVLGLVLGLPWGPPLASLLIAAAFAGVWRSRRAHGG